MSDPRWYLERLPPVADVIALLGSDPRATLLRAAKGRAVASNVIAAAAKDPDHPDLALLAQANATLKKLLHANASAGDELFTPDEHKVLGLVTLLVGRPSLFMQAGRPLNPPPAWKRVEEDAELIVPNGQAVGCLCLGDSVAGTGFLVSDRLVLTNNHVVVALAKGLLPAGAALRPQDWFEKPALYAKAVAAARKSWPPGPLAPRFELGREVGQTAASTVVAVRTVRAHHLEVDMALLELAAPITTVAPLTLSGASLPFPEDEEVYVIGYPVSTHNALGQTTAPLFVLEHVFQTTVTPPGATHDDGWTLATRRLAPGRLHGRGGEAAVQPSSPVTATFKPALRHDASTLGGNSGSPVCDFATHRVVGLHFAGSYGDQTNYAIPLAEHAASSFFTEAKIDFDGVD